MYFALAASFFIGDLIQSKSFNIDYGRIAFVMIFCSLFGGLLELAQWFLPNRNTSICNSDYYDISYQKGKTK